MLIANPIYDVVFKRLMENERVAKFFIGTFLNATVEELEKLLTLFEQAHFIDENGILKEYPYQLDEEEFKLMVNILHHTGTNPETRKEIETEQEAWRSIDAMFGKRERELMEELNQKEEEINKKDEEINKKDEALEKERQEKEQLLRELEELKKRFKGEE